MTSSEGKPWTAPATHLVLLKQRRIHPHRGGRQRDRWRYAIYNEVGIIDGHLDSPLNCPLDQVQRDLLAKVEALTGLHYDTVWTGDSSDCWSAQLVIKT